MELKPAYFRFAFYSFAISNNESVPSPGLNKHSLSRTVVLYSTTRHALVFSNQSWKLVICEAIAL